MSRSTRLTIPASIAACLVLTGTAVASATPTTQGAETTVAGVQQQGVTNAISTTLTYIKPQIDSTGTGFIIETAMSWRRGGFIKAGYQSRYNASGVETTNPYLSVNDGVNRPVVLPAITVHSGQKLNLSIYLSYEGTMTSPIQETITWSYITVTDSVVRYHLLAQRVLEIDANNFVGKVSPSWQIEKAQNANSQFLPLTYAAYKLTGVYDTRTGLINQPITTGGPTYAYEMTPSGIYHGNTCDPNAGNAAVVVPSSVSSNPGDSTMSVTACSS